MNNKINKTFQKASWLNRGALFVVFFWFGFLKIIGTSPAEGLVTELFKLTLSPFMELETFLPLFGALECILGILWLMPNLTKWAFLSLMAHMACTFLPMVLLPTFTWQSFLTLTLVGQYIVKNVVLIGSSWFIYTLYRAKEEKAHLLDEPSEVIENLTVTITAEV